MGFLADLAFRRRGTILVVLALLTLLAVLYGRGTARNLVAGGFLSPNSESSHADALLEQRFRLGTPDVVVSYAHDTLKVEDPAFARSLSTTLEALRRDPGVERVSSPYGAHPDALVSKDRHLAIVSLRFKQRGQASESAFDAIAPKLPAAGLNHLVGGAIPAARQAQVAAEKDLVRAELITLPLVAVLLVVFFRGVVVALLPLLVGGFAVAQALASIRLLTHFGDVSIFAMNIVTFVGLGVAIDYSLFMTSRFRDELALGKSVAQALDRTLQTSGRTIAYSGAAVAVSLMALFVFPLMLLRSVALAGSLVVVMSLVGALLLLPAMLAVLGPRIEWLSLGKKQRRWGLACLGARGPGCHALSRGRDDQRQRAASAARPAVSAREVGRCRRIDRDLGSVAGLTDRIVVMRRGEIVEIGSTSSVTNNPQHPYTKLLVGSAPTLASGASDRRRRDALRAELQSA